MKISHPLLADCEQIVNLLIESISEGCTEDHRNQQDILDKWLENKTKNNVMTWLNNTDNISLVARNGDTLMGIGLISKSNPTQSKFANLRLLYIKPNIFKQGIGTALLKRLEFKAVQLGEEGIELDSTVTAKTFYEKNNYLSRGSAYESKNLITCYPMVKEFTHENMLLKTTDDINVVNTGDKLSIVNSKVCLQYSINIFEQPYLLDMLDFCLQTKPYLEVCDFLKSLSGLSDLKSQQGIKTLIKTRLLNVFHANQDCFDKKFKNEWQQNGWQDALIYHTHINHLKKTNYSLDPKGLADKNLMQTYLSQENPPSSYKTYDTSPIMLQSSKETCIKLKKLDEIYLDHVGESRDSSAPTYEELSWLLHFGFGQIGNKTLPITGEHLRKTIPSGGARHPTEVYPIIFSVSGIESGLYHYNVKSHALELLKQGDHLAFFRSHIITHPTRPTFKPYVGFVFTTLFERSMFRYRESRSYKVLHYDLGHVMQNFASLASAINRSSYRGYSFHDDLVDKFLGIDTLSESSLAFCILG